MVPSPLGFYSWHPTERTLITITPPWYDLPKFPSPLVYDAAYPRIILANSAFLFKPKKIFNLLRFSLQILVWRDMPKYAIMSTMFRRYRFISMLCVISFLVWAGVVLFFESMTWHENWKSKRIEYHFGVPKNNQIAPFVATGQEEKLSRSDLRLMVSLLGDPLYGMNAYLRLINNNHARIFPYLLNAVDKPLAGSIQSHIVRLIGREGHNEYVNRPLARRKLLTLINNGMAVSESITALGVVGLPSDIPFIKQIPHKSRELEAVKRIACARLGDAESMLLTARYLAEHGVVPVEQWHQKMGCMVGPPLNREIPYAEYIDREEFHRYYGQAVRKLNPESLIIQWSPIPDFTFLEGLRVKHLQITTTKAMNLEFTKHLQLETLEITFTQISDLSPLTSSNLKSLNLASCKGITSIEPLRGLALTNLVLYHADITDLSPLRGMPLEVLQLGSTKVKDLSPLKGAPLRELWISDNPSISDLSPLEGSPLTMLSAGLTSIKDLAPIKNCPLKHLSINGTNVTDLRPVEHMDLDYLYVTEKNIEYGIDFLKRVTEKMKKAPVYE